MRTPQNTTLRLFWEVYHTLLAHRRRHTIYEIIDSLPDGKEIAVFMIQGFGTNEEVFTHLKNVLIRKEFIVEIAKIGYNWGPTLAIEEKIVTSFQSFAQHHSQVRILGHSLGAAAALGLAYYNPKKVPMVVSLTGAHGHQGVLSPLKTAFRMSVGETPEESFARARKRNIHTINHIPVFNFVGTEDGLLDETVTIMEGNDPEHVFRMKTSHGGILKHRNSIATIVHLLAMNLK